MRRRLIRWRGDRDDFVQRGNRQFGRRSRQPTGHGQEQGAKAEDKAVIVYHVAAPDFLR